MPKTQKKNKKKPSPLRKGPNWSLLWTRYGKILISVGFVLAIGWVGWTGAKSYITNRYPNAYVEWWKATLRLEQDAREGKTEIDHAQTWLNASQRLLRMRSMMKWFYAGVAPDNPLDSLAELTANYRLKPDKIPSQVDEITVLHNRFTDYHQYLGLTKPVFLADRLVQEWNRLKQLIQTNAEGDKIQASIQLINLQIPLLEPYWLQSDITNLSVIGNTCETLWIHQRAEEILQLLLSSDYFLTRACLEPTY